MKESRTKSTVINTYMGMMVKGFNVIINFFMRTIFIRCLGTEYSGVSSLFTDILTILSFAELGIASAITFELYKPLVSGDEEQITKLMNFFKCAYQAVALTVLVAGLCFIPFMKYVIVDVPSIREPIILIYLLYLVNASASYLLIYKSTLLIADQRKYLVSSIEIAIAMIRTLMQCVILFVFKNYIGFLGAMIAFTLLQNIVVSVQVDRNYPFLKKYNSKLDKKEISKILKDVKALSLYKIAGAVLNGTDSVIISSVVGTVQVGMVANYKLVIAGVDGILQQFYSAVEPSIGNLAVEAEWDKQFQIFRITQFMTFWISCFSTVLFAVLLNPFMELWLGNLFVLPRYIVIALVLNFYVTMMMRSVASFRTANGLFVQGQHRPLVMSILNIVLSIILGIKWKVFGILIATVISRLLTQAWFDPLLVYRNVFQVPFLNYVKQYVEYGIVAVIVYLITDKISSLFIHSNLFLEFAGRLFVAILISNLILAIVYYRKTEFKELLNICKRFKSKVRRRKEC